MIETAYPYYTSRDNKIATSKDFKSHRLANDAAATAFALLTPSEQLAILDSVKVAV